MVLNRFFFNVLIRIVGISATCVLMGIVAAHADGGYYYTLAGVIFLILLQTVWLVDAVNRTNRDIEEFFLSVHDADSSVHFTIKKNSKAYRKLYDHMNHLNTILQQVKTENERKSLFLQDVVDHLDTGLLTFDDAGNIVLFNRTAVRFTNTHLPRHISAIQAKNEELYKVISGSKPGQEQVHKLVMNDQQKNILVKAGVFRSDNIVLRLVSLQDITEPLDRKELDSWQKLIRVLTHEIMNSISPITSLTRVISGYFRKEDSGIPVSPEEISPQVISKILFGLNTIEETGKGLLDFVDKYRSFAFLPSPETSCFRIDKLFRGCVLLMETAIPANIHIESDIHPADITLQADFSQVEQVLINLLRNAAEAIPAERLGNIRLMAYQDDENVIIQVEDNGTGIPSDLTDNIFVPFFTTRENGSGIGLSLSKQVMQNHNGSISVNTGINKGTAFTLSFPRITG